MSERNTTLKTPGRSPEKRAKDQDSTAKALARAVLPERRTHQPETEGSYKNGWGFFDDRKGIFDREYAVYGDDDFFVDQLVEDRASPEVELLPLSPERQKVAAFNMTRFMEAAWGLPYKKFEDLEHARNKIDKIERPEHKSVRDEMTLQGRYLQYQSSVQYRDQTKDPKSLHDILSGPYSWPTMLYFGRPMNWDSIPPGDRLDSFVRVYVHTKPEYVGAVAGKAILEMRRRFDTEIYGKLTDVATANGESFDRPDNLLFYAQSHSQLAGLATILREMTTSHPDLFRPEFTSQDVACQTDIPGVSIGEEPVQKNDFIQESFNSSREDIPGKAIELISSGLVKKHPELKGTYGTQILKTAYEKNLITKSQIKHAFHKAVRAISAQRGISTKNFAFNERP